MILLMPQTSRACSEATVFHNMLFTGRSHNRQRCHAGRRAGQRRAGNWRGNSEIRF